MIHREVDTTQIELVLTYDGVLKSDQLLVVGSDGDDSILELLLFHVVQLESKLLVEDWRYLTLFNFGYLALALTGHLNHAITGGTLRLENRESSNTIIQKMSYVGTRSLASSIRTWTV